MLRLRASLQAITLAVLIGVSASAHSAQATFTSDRAAAHRSGLHDFDFLTGDWRVRHRYLRVNGNVREWVEVDGTCINKALMGGYANAEEHTIAAPTGTYHGIALRSYDAKTGRWAIWWIDGRKPHGDVDPPMMGRFESGIGTFFGETLLDGKSVRVRFVWPDITPASAHWEQAYSYDGGKSWERNWVMEFQRTASAAKHDADHHDRAPASPLPASSTAEGAHAPSRPISATNFDFLTGKWRVHHRRQQRRSGGDFEWVEFEGTCMNRPLIDGSANLEEHTLNAPAGPYRAVALRAFDPKSAQWAIWWLDGRYPAGPIGPPVKGAFADSIGAFYSDYEQDGKPMRVRFLWSKITSISARWEQAVSADGGNTWETNWIMQFQRDEGG